MKRRLRRYYSREKALAYIRDHPELHGVSVKVLARQLKLVGLLAPTTYYRDCPTLLRIVQNNVGAKVVTSWCQPHAHDL